MNSGYHYSVIIKTKDEAVLSCLRGLSHYAQRTGNNRIPCRGTGKSDWIHNNYSVVFHFSKPEYRSSFVRQISRLFHESLWEKVGEEDKITARK